MKLAGRGGAVKFSGGTCSCHPALMLGSFTMMEHLVGQENVVYPRITDRNSNAIPASTMAAVHFPYDPATPCDSPDQTRNPDVCDVELSDLVL